MGYKLGIAIAVLGITVGTAACGSGHSSSSGARDDPSSKATKPSGKSAIPPPPTAAGIARAYQAYVVDNQANHLTGTHTEVMAAPLIILACRTLITATPTAAYAAVTKADRAILSTDTPYTDLILLTDASKFACSSTAAAMDRYLAAYAALAGGEG